MSSCFLPPNSLLPTPSSQLSPPNSHLPTPTSQPSSTPILCVATRKSQRDKIEYSHTLTFSHSHTLTPSHPQSSLAQLGIPLTDVLKVLVAGLLLGNILFYEAKNQELSMQGSEGIPIPPSPLHTPHTILPHPLCSSFIPPSLPPRAAGSGEPPGCAAPAPPESTHSQNLPLWERTSCLLSLLCGCCKCHVL